MSAAPPNQNIDSGTAAVRGVVLYVGLGLGLYLTSALQLFFGGETNDRITEGELASAAASGLEQLTVLGLVLAAGFTLYVFVLNRGTSVAVPTVVAVTLGTFLSGFVLLLCLMIFGDTGTRAFGFAFRRLFSLTLGAGITAFVCGAGLELTG